jgi:hypothetical protein
MLFSIPKSKIFGLGLSATGTTTLNEALIMLGYKMKHMPLDKKTFEELKRGKFNLSVLDKFNGITDIIASPYYAQFDELYPGSKFILTTRNKEEWLESLKRKKFFSDGWIKNRIQIGTSHVEFIDNVVYGTTYFSEKRFSYVFDLHSKNVREYFKDRPDDFLEIDICGGEEWEPLCEFLKKPISQKPFPHMNKYKR